MASTFRSKKSIDKNYETAKQFFSKGVKPNKNFLEAHSIYRTPRSGLKIWDIKRGSQKYPIIEKGSTTIDFNKNYNRNEKVNT